MEQTLFISPPILRPSFALRLHALSKWHEADELTDRILFLYECGKLTEQEAAEMWHEVEDLQVQACELDDAYEMVYEIESAESAREVN